MPHRRVRLSVDGPVLRDGFEAIRVELKVPAEFPPEVLAAAAQAAARWSPANSTAPDQTDVPYLTIDPPGSMDLDQAMYIARNRQWLPGAVRDCRRRGVRVAR